jgi:hypothetical protein
MEQAPARSGLDAAQYADLKFWLPGDILTKVDRASMAVSLEAREPLLDHRLIEFAAGLPEGMRIRGTQGKWLMKQAMKPQLPDDILFRPKQGFVTPIAQWFRGLWRARRGDRAGRGPVPHRLVRQRRHRPCRSGPYRGHQRPFTPAVAIAATGPLADPSGAGLGLGRPVIALAGAG